METNKTNWTGTDQVSPGAGVGFGFVTIMPGVIGNIIAIIIFSKAVRKTCYAVHCLLLALAITDLFGCVLACYTAATAYTGDIENPVACNILMFITSLCPMATAVVTCLLALDRYFALCHPFTYKKYTGQNTALIAIVSTIGASTAISMLPFIKLGNYYMESIDGDGEMVVICSALRFQPTPRERVYGVLYGTSGVVVITTVLIANVLVIRTVLSMKKTLAAPPRLFQNNSPSTSHSRLVSTEVKFAKMVTGISIILFICWTPFMVLMILVHTGVELSLDRISPIMILASINFIVDPFVHIVLRRSYRLAVWKNVCCCGCFNNNDHATMTSEVPNSFTDNDKIVSITL